MNSSQLYIVEGEEDPQLFQRTTNVPIKAHQLKRNCTIAESCSSFGCVSKHAYFRCHQSPHDLESTTVLQIKDNCIENFAIMSKSIASSIWGMGLQNRYCEKFRKTQCRLQYPKKSAWTQRSFLALSRFHRNRKDVFRFFEIFDEHAVKFKGY